MFRADLHIHSRFSRATSKNLTIRNLAAYASIKGIHLLGTGDITHPEWLKELEKELIYDSHTGFFNLKTPLTPEDIFRETTIRINSVSIQPQFILQGEISCIYKKNNKVRKNHQLIFVPDFTVAKKINTKLSAIGNLTADGRPMLGLDAKILFALILEEKNAFLIPAHIWTPWFSVFGSKSGFDSLEDCFEDLTPEIFALETGLSSNPPMNRLVSKLDPYVLISNSDAHSGENLGREVNIFHDKPNYLSLFEAFKRKNNLFYGTVEFYPEEGKYFADGHRVCNICCTPTETKQHNLICPICHKPLTLGVNYRINLLADRNVPIPVKEQFESCIPLKEILAQCLNVGAKSKKVHQEYEKLIQTYHTELDILQNIPISDFKNIHKNLAKALHNMRSNTVYKKYGYDGEYGEIQVIPKDQTIDN